MGAAMKIAMVFWVLAAVCVAWMYISLQVVSPTLILPWYLKVGEILIWFVLPGTLLGAGVASAFALKSK